ncbi:hypothetical protein ACFPES_01805 [Paenibacillus sp. GCM10023248]|uniref:hypothetical protein n=1 Tax=Bacillus sp. 3255 TaxID=2817904 RepID=UPI00286A6892|nr:hypothetical protein [Bacillus sp. 3255]MDD9265758.1 hypothetical protein [Paenibacillus sp. MAHUQ-63]
MSVRSGFEAARGQTAAVHGGKCTPRVRQDRLQAQTAAELAVNPHRFLIAMTKDDPAGSFFCVRYVHGQGRAACNGHSGPYSLISGRFQHVTDTSAVICLRGADFRLEIGK